jgi:tetratricopeptide (TPR) repeat protein
MKKILIILVLNLITCAMNANGQEMLHANDSLIQTSNTINPENTYIQGRKVDQKDLDSAALVSKMNLINLNQIDKKTDYFPGWVLLIPLFVLILRPFIVLLHELGHAIPAIIMTKEIVSIYIGSFGDSKKSFQLKGGLLVVWISKNPFSWTHGYCVSKSKEFSLNKQLIFTLTGPFMSLIISVISSYFILFHDLSGLLKLILLIVLASSLIDFFWSIIPRSKPINRENGKWLYNDGFQIKELLYLKKLPKEYSQGVSLYNKEKYAEAALLFSEILKRGFKHIQIYRLTISSFLQVKNYEQPKEFMEEFAALNELNSDDFGNIGVIYSYHDQHEVAMEFYDKSLNLNPNNKYSLNNKGFTLNFLHKYEEAIPLFDQVITIDGDFAYSYSNRGLAKIKMGQLEEGREDIHYSIKLDDSNSYSFCHMGIYFLEKGENKSALDLFKKAKEMDSTTYRIDELISQAQNEIKTIIY